MLALRMPWPLPALAAWACAWLIFVALQRAVPPVAALLVACLLGTAASVLGDSWWRRGLIAAGFPLSLALLGAAGKLDHEARHCFMPTLVRRHSVMPQQIAGPITN